MSKIKGKVVPLYTFYTLLLEFGITTILLCGKYGKMERYEGEMGWKMFILVVAFINSEIKYTKFAGYYQIINFFI